MSRRLIRAGGSYTNGEDIQLEEVEPNEQPPEDIQGEPWGWRKDGPKPRGWRKDGRYDTN